MTSLAKIFTSQDYFWVLNFHLISALLKSFEMEKDNMMLPFVRGCLRTR